MNRTHFRSFSNIFVLREPPLGGTRIISQSWHNVTQTGPPEVYATLTQEKKATMSLINGIWISV